MSSVAILLLAATLSAGTQPRWCSAPELGMWPMGALRKIVSNSGAEADVRRRLYDLPAVSADSVQLVRDESVCERAARAYYRYELGPYPPGGVAVFRIRNRYAVYGAVRAGEWTILSIYSDRFERIAGIAL